MEAPHDDTCSPLSVVIRAIIATRAPQLGPVANRLCVAIASLTTDGPGMHDALTMHGPTLKPSLHTASSCFIHMNPEPAGVAVSHSRLLPCPSGTNPNCVSTSSTNDNYAAPWVAASVFTTSQVPYDGSRHAAESHSCAVGSCWCCGRCTSLLLTCADDGLNRALSLMLSVHAVCVSQEAAVEIARVFQQQVPEYSIQETKPLENGEYYLRYQTPGPFGPDIVECVRPCCPPPVSPFS